MPLSSDLISQFVKATKDTNTEKPEKTVYATMVEYDGGKYVRLDGSEFLTPVSITTNADDGDRVMVAIKNHQAIVTGNVTSPSPTTSELQGVDSKVDNIGSKISDFEIIIAGKVDTQELNAANARIDELQTDNVTIKKTLDANAASIKQLEANEVTINGTLDAHAGYFEELGAVDAEITGRLDAADANIDSIQADNVVIREELNAQKANINTLTANNVEINRQLTAQDADIADLEAKKLSVESADLKYANIDFSNVGEAAMEYFYANSGLIRDVVIDEGTITGNLVGVTIKGDIIEGGTVIADKLVIQGEDGLYYKLNTNGVTTSTEQTEYNSLNGSIITANTITAEKINVSDLVAFDATIGGFHITEHSIYSEVKSSVDNTTRGIYMDDDGQIAFGDERNFVKFFKDTDGNYKLEITAAVIKFGSNNKNLEEALESLDGLDGLEIGGRNLLQYTDVSENFDEWVPWAESILDIGEDGYLKITPAEAATSAGAYPRHSAKLEVGVEYTLSFMAYADSDITLNYLYIMDPTGNIQIVTTVPITATPDKYTHTFTVDTEHDSASIMIAYQYSAGATVPIYIRDLKLEKGTVATDWTSSPEDTEHAIDDAMNAASSNTERINDVQLDLDSINATISSLVTGANGESLMTQTETGWTFNIAAIQKTLSDATSDIGNLSSDLDYMSGALNALNNSVDDLGVYTDYIQFGTDNGKPCIILGEVDSAFKVLITNTDIRFVEGTSVPAYISNQSLHVEKAVISDELRQGDFVWIARENGNYGLLWKGE